MHLNFKSAFAYNPFLVISVPYAILLIVVTWIVPKNRLIGIRRFCYHHITVRIYLVMMVIWWIVRNI